MMLYLMMYWHTSWMLAKARTVGPVGPGGPSAPNAGTVGPVGPIGPVGPVSPWEEGVAVAGVAARRVPNWALQLHGSWDATAALPFDMLRRKP